MAAKVDRIFDLLPSTFAVGPPPSPLAALVSTYGGELQAAENALAAVMRSHWVDHADFGAETIDDLARFAALYGLAPRDDDRIEEFRERLRLWVRLILEGPATVRGLLRAASVILGVRIDDGDAALDAWWRRRGNTLTTIVASRRDAARALLGVEAAAAAGAAATPARLRGRISLAATVDLSAGALLRLEIDGGAAQTIDLAQGAAEPKQVAPAHIVARINAELGAPIAAMEGEHLSLTSPSAGAASGINVADGPDDAAPAILGLPASLAHGADASAARYTSPVDLAGGADLSVNRYIRLRIDGDRLSEIDCAGDTPAATTLDDVCDAINAALGPPAVASHDGSRLTLASPTAGSTSSIAFLTPAAQDATTILFGQHPSVVVGAAASPATIIGTVDLRAGIDLRQVFNLTFSVDGGAPVEVNCAGADPASTELPELVAAIDATAPGTASHDGRHLILRGKILGPAGSLAIGRSDAADASAALLGLPERRAAGNAAQRARIEGTVDLSGGVNLAAQSLLRLSVDLAPARTIDIAAGVVDPSAMTADAIAAAINAALGVAAADAEAGRLVIESPTDGAAGHVAVEPIQTETRRRFLSRIAIADDAAAPIFGFVSGKAAGTPASPASLIGTVDLSRGVDLSGGRFLRISLDGKPGVDIDCAGPRPRASTPGEVVGEINKRLAASVATLAGGYLVLTSPTTGPASRLDLAPPRGTDALDLLLGIAPTSIRGKDASQVRFAGTVDLSAGVDLGAGSKLRLAVDGGAPVEIDCAGADPAATRLSRIVIAINVALGVNVASHDGAHLLLTSPTAGPGSRLDILAPSAGDATLRILGIPPGRTYRGAPATPAEIVGATDLGGTVDLHVARYLRLGVDRNAPVDIDCAQGSADPSMATLATIVQAINDAIGLPIAGERNGRLALTSPSTGLSSRLTLEPTLAGDARAALLGSAPSAAEGSASQPATLVGTKDLRPGVDLHDGSLLRIVAGGRAVDIDVGGAVEAATAAGEIVAAINAVFPGMAELSPEGFLRLRAVEENVEALAIEPLRYFEAIEYLPEPDVVSEAALAHAGRLRFRNAGATAGFGRFSITSELGAGSPGFASIATGWEMRLLGALEPGGTVGFEAGQDGSVVATRSRPDGSSEAVAAQNISVAPLAPHLAWPRDISRKLARDKDERRRLTLSHPEGPELVILSERTDGGATVAVQPAAAIPQPPATGAARPTIWTGRLVRSTGELALVDAGGNTTAHIRPALGSVAERLVGRIVALTGRVVGAASPPIIRAEQFWELLDLTLTRKSDPDAPGETFAGVALAGPAALQELSLVWRINVAPAPSAFVSARLSLQADGLNVERGGNEWIYVDCLSSRFDHSFFNEAHFAGSPCLEQGVFNVSRFAETPRAATTPVFARIPEPDALPAAIGLQFDNHRPATVRINLPADLTPRYGARFNEDRFALRQDAPVILSGVVTEPKGDPDFLIDRVKAAEKSSLVSAKTVTIVPIGFQAVEIPFSRPVFLTGGRADRPARLFLTEPGLDDFIEIAAKENGDYGDRISLVVTRAGPGRFDLKVAFAGARFENARATVLGLPVTGSTDDLLKPGPRGLLHLKAGGVRLEVTRDATPD